VQTYLTLVGKETVGRVSSACVCKIYFCGSCS